MALRFPQREPRDAKELFQWLRELLPDLEIKVIENAVVETNETPIAHGLGAVPFFVRCSTPHCLALVRQTRKADGKCIYLRATNRCVVDVYVVKYAQLAPLTTSMRNGGYHLPDWDPSGGGTDDHLVIADTSDTAPGTLSAKNVAGVGIAQSVVVDSGTRKLETRSLGLTVAVHGDTPDVLYQTVRGKYPVRTNVAGTAPARYVEISVDPTTPPPDPATYAGDIYTAVFADPLDCGTVKCILTHGEAIIFPAANFIDASAVYGPHSWKLTTLAGIVGVGGIPLLAGDRVLVWTPVPYGSDANYFWVYDVIDPGIHADAPSTYAVIRRSPVPLERGAFVYIQQGENAGKIAVITNAGAITPDTTAVEITMVSDHAAVPTWPLVTAKQLSGSYEGNAEAVALPTAATPAYFTGLGPRYEMLFGTPMPTEVDAGDWQIQIACKVSSLTDASSGDAPCDTIIRSEFGIVDMSGSPTYSPLFTVDSTPIKFIGTEQVITVDQSLAGFSLGPDQYFYWTPQARTTSVGTIAVTILVASPQHLTRIRTPITFATTGGTNVHNELTGRFNDVGLGEAPEHNADGIGPGFLHTPFETSTITSGLLPSPTRNNIIATLASGTELKWIGTAKMSAGDTVTVRFVDSIILRHGSGSVPASSAPLWLNGSDMEDRDVNWLDVPFGNCVACFQLYTDGGIALSPCWRMLWNRTGELLT